MDRFFDKIEVGTVVKRANARNGQTWRFDNCHL